MNIAICDDEKGIAELFSAKVTAVEPDSEIAIFTSGEDLIESEFECDVVFLDIEMKPMNGFQTAEILKEKYPRCILSFITTHSELAVEGYDYQPFRYILKTAPEPVIKRKIRETLNEYYYRNKSLHIAYKGKHSVVLVGDIIYIEIEGHCTKLVLKNGVVSWNKPLNDIEVELKKYGVIRCHKSFMVSLAQVKEVNQNWIKLKRGINVPIGRTHKNSFIKEYNNYILVN